MSSSIARSKGLKWKDGLDLDHPSTLVVDCVRYTYTVEKLKLYIIDNRVNIVYAKRQGVDIRRPYGGRLSVDGPKSQISDLRFSYSVRNL